ncbi:MAG: hypothetical protein R2932_07025 [Caldilineaceae bacterium]
MRLTRSTTLRSMLHDEAYQLFDPAADQFLDLPVEVTHMILPNGVLEDEIFGTERQAESSWKNIHAFATMQLEITAGIEMHKIIDRICAVGIRRPRLPHLRTQSRRAARSCCWSGSAAASQLSRAIWPGSRCSEPCAVNGRRNLSPLISNDRVCRAILSSFRLCRSAMLC